MQSTADEHQPSPLRSPSTADEDQRPPPSTPDAAHESLCPRPRPVSGTAFAQQQIGGGTAPDPPHSRPPPTHSPHHSLNHLLPDGSQTGQTEGPNTEGRQSDSRGSAGKRPSSNDEVSKLDRLIES